ncbi:MAG: SAM-dependent chlorinase/fluorinase [Candidatus Aminicenantes bacterium]|nr:MAG: SAM-dependent chlorinase/fluorinase [Candidatus Aminicenantes bacterium]
MKKNPVIALMTDFGEDDFFVGSLKGVIAKINPSAQIIDITHRIPSFDVGAASLVLLSSYNYFPKRTIFLVVVDPGVGSFRRILLAKTKEFFFIAPDNGVLSLVIEDEKIEKLIELKNMKFFLPRLSGTFEGRDKMAPVAAWLSKGISCEEFGAEIKQYKKLKIQKPVLKGKEIIGQIVYIDKFGNLITNIPGPMLDSLQAKSKKVRLVLNIKGIEIKSFVQSYSDAKRAELVFLVDSLWMVEIAAREASAAKKLKAKIGDEARIIIKL